jgi:hypothetical protein
MTVILVLLLGFSISLLNLGASLEVIHDLSLDTAV